MPFQMKALAALCLAAPAAGFSSLIPSFGVARKPRCTHKIPETFQDTAPKASRECRFRLKSTDSSVNEETGITIGDTKGAILLIQDCAVFRGSNKILSNVNFRVERGQRWGIVGPNGAGKSTLLGALTGTASMDAGKALVAPKTDVG